MNIPVSLANVIYRADDPPPGLWCCIGCEEVHDASEPEDYHIARCPKAQRLIAQRAREFGTRRPHWDDD